jgi:hypothetical protein
VNQDTRERGQADVTPDAEVPREQLRTLPEVLAGILAK